MPLSALGLVLLAAVLHSAWNLVIKASDDRLAAAWMQTAFGAIVFLPVLIVQGLPRGQWESLSGSTVLHLGYAVTLVAAYDRGDLSVVYPIARGSAPLLVTIGAALLLDDRPGAGGVAAVVLIAAGILGMIRRSRGGVAWAIACGGFIAGYTLVDGAAVRATGGGALRYVVTLIALNAVTLLVVVMTRRHPDELAAAVRRDWLRNALGGAASVAAYALVLTAARWAPLGLVSAVRETSVVFGALGGWLLLKEPFGAARIRASALIATGLILLVVG